MRPLVPASSHGRRRLAVCDWPQADRDAWARATAPSSPLDLDRAKSRNWRPTTRRFVEEGYGRWLAWLEDRIDIHATDVVLRTTREHVEAYRCMLVGANCAPYTISARIAAIANAVKSIRPAHDWTWLARGAWRMHQDARPAKDVADKLQPIQDVLHLGRELMTSADAIQAAAGVVPTDAAVMFRDGLLVAFQALRPLRRRNLGSIALSQFEARGDALFLKFAAGEMKGHVAFEVPWPSELRDALSRYLSVYRPALLCGKEIEALWVGTHGGPLGEGNVVHRLVLRTKRRFGRGINAHSFRHNVATTVAEEAPEAVSILPEVLAHKEQRTSEKYYNLSKGTRATERLQRVVRPSGQRRGMRHVPLADGPGPLFDSLKHQGRSENEAER